jgi:hypothetical protein
MKAKGKFISFLLIVDTFFVSYALGFNTRHVLEVDPKLPPYVAKQEAKTETKPAAVKPEEKNGKDAKQGAGAKEATFAAGEKKTGTTEPAKKSAGSADAHHKKKVSKTAHHSG